MAEDSQEPNSDLDNRFKFSNYTPNANSRFARYLARVGLALVVIALLILGGRWVHHQFFASNNNGSADTQGSAPKTPSGTEKKPAASSGSSSSSSRSSSAATNTSTLPNNGPGATAAIFAGATAVGAGLHYIAAARRQSAKR